MKHAFFTASVVAMSSLLAGCGGGGSSGSTSVSAQSSIPPVTTIASTNYQPAAATGASGTDIINGANSTSGITVGVALQSKPGGIVQPVLGLINLASHHLPASATGVAINESAACQTSGSITLTGNVADQSRLSAGDTVSVTANACVQNGVTSNGAFSFVVNSVTGSDGDPSWSGDFTLAFAGISIMSLNGAVEVTDSIDGDLRIGFSQTDVTHQNYTFSGSSLTGKRFEDGAMAREETLADFSGSETMDGANITSAFDFSIFGTTNTLGSYSYAVKTTQPFQSINDGTYPYAGSLTVTGKSSSVTLTALSNTQVRLDFSDNEGGTVTTSTTETWAEFEASI